MAHLCLSQATEQFLALYSIQKLPQLLRLFSRNEAGYGKSQLENETKSKFKCNKCNGQFENLMSYKSAKKVHLVMHPYECDKGNVLFTSEKQLTTHK